MCVRKMMRSPYLTLGPQSQVSKATVGCKRANKSLQKTCHHACQVRTHLLYMKTWLIQVVKTLNVCYIFKCAAPPILAVG